MPVELTRRNFHQYDHDGGFSGVIAPTLGEACTNTLTLAANVANFSRFIVSRPMIITFLSYSVTTAAGSDDAVDVGLFTVSGSNLSRIVSAGATTGQLNSQGQKKIAVTATGLVPGTIYYAGLSCGAVGSTAAVIMGGGWNNVNANRLMGTALPNLVNVTLGTSHPLPSSVVGPTATSIGPKIGCLEV